MINPTRSITYLRLAELLLGPVKDAGRAVKILYEARRRFPDADVRRVTFISGRAKMLFRNILVAIQASAAGDRIVVDDG